MTTRPPRQGAYEAQGTQPPLPSSRRKYPRADLRVKAHLRSAADPKRFFEATLETENISVGGIFFESTFFLKVGTEVEVELALPPDDRRVRARGSVVRVESMVEGEKGRSGFAVKFYEYYDGSEVVLATYFLAPMLRAFIEDYARKHRIDAKPEYVAHVADVLAAWEFAKAEGPDALLYNPPAKGAKAVMPSRLRDDEGAAGGKARRR